MLAAIEGAQREVLIEIYWFGADRVGEKFRAALIDRARRGVRVSIVYDTIGSWETPGSFWRPLVEAGAEVHEFEPLWPPRAFRRGRVPLRDHRKIVVVDADVGFTGGINVGELWEPPEAPQLAFRDDAVELHGPSVRALRARFFDTWRRVGRSVPDDADDPVASRAARGAPVRVLANRFGRRPKREIRSAYLYGLRHATTTIDIANAYFLPDAIFLHALRNAARRGVRVRVLVPDQSDVWIVSLAAQSLFGRMLASKIQVFAYLPRVLHTKTAVFDGRYALLGSHNLDAMSFRYNLECDVLVDSVEFAHQVASSFERDLGDSHKKDLASWRARPLWIRLLGWIAALFRRWL